MTQVWWVEGARRGCSVSPGTPTRVIAACSGLAGFAVAIVAGLNADNPSEVILTRALAALVACQLLGCVIGMIGEHAVRRAVSADLAGADMNSESTAVSIAPPGRAEVVPNS